MKKFGRRQWILLVLFLLTLTVTGLFATRAIRRAAYWRDHRDETIRPWMSVGYVANSYRVPRPVLNQAIGIEPNIRDRRPLREIAAQQKRPVSTLISELSQAIDEHRKAHPPGGPELLDGDISP